MPENAEKAVYPRLVGGRWVESPLAHLAIYEARARDARESHVAVPAELLLRVSRWRECSAREVFLYDEDGRLPEPFEAVCRREQGHDATGNPDHVRQHSNGYFTWCAGSRIPPDKDH